MELAPGEPLLSRDNLDSMQRDNIASTQPFAPAAELGIELHPSKPRPRPTSPDAVRTAGWTHTGRAHDARQR